MRLTIQPLLLALTIVCASTALSAQLELGVKLGAAIYGGDLSPPEFGDYFSDVNFAGGAYLRYRPVQRFGVRVNGNFGSLSASRDFSIPNGAGERRPVTREFRTTITEFNLVGEADLFYLGDPETNFIAPYVYGGVGVLSYNPQARNREGNFVDLQPLSTEGQGVNNPRYSTPYELTRLVGVAGGGVRARFAERFVIGLEGGLRFTGTDYLDDISDLRVNYNDVLAGPGGSEGAYFFNPAVENPLEVQNNFEIRRGGPFNDYYAVASLTLGITIGGGSGGGKSGCYSF